MKKRPPKPRLKPRRIRFVDAPDMVAPKGGAAVQIEVLNRDGRWKLTLKRPLHVDLEVMCKVDIMDLPGGDLHISHKWLGDAGKRLTTEEEALFVGALEANIKATLGEMGEVGKAIVIERVTTQ